MAGEEVAPAVPAGKTNRWRCFDYEDRLQGDQPAVDGRVALGPLPAGWYRLRHAGDPATDWVSLAVIEPLKAPTPTNSPVALDVAMAWFYPRETMDAAARLCALAGVNWVRDRLNWGEMAPRKTGPMAEGTRYDASARAQSAAGLQLLQVHHSSPGWASPEHKRFPADLRDAYEFQRAVAQRWQGQVAAFEPWNEADIDMFGGHTGAEIASLQKASYLGLKAGNPAVVAGQNVFASHRPAQLEDFHQNEAWPYFDTFNLHHYEPFDQYPALYAAFRAVSAGRPLWVSECAYPVKWAGGEKLKEVSDADLRIQSERLVKTFALSILEGASATFYFMLPHYVEGQTQFGIARPDLTPRPAWASLAAAGRLLAGARALGSVPSTNPAVRACVFEARPDGQARPVLVAWAEGGPASLALPRAADWAVDHLGRALPRPGPVLTLGSAPVLVVLEAGAVPGLRPAPARAAVLPGEPSPVVLQAVFAPDKTVLSRSACRIDSGAPAPLALFAYNFSAQAVRGRLRMTAPAGWKTRLTEDLELQPMERRDLGAVVDCREGTGGMVEPLRVTGDFGAAGRPVLSFRLMPDPRRRTVREAFYLPGWTNAARWAGMISEPGKLQIQPAAGGLSVDASPAGPDRWVYPRYNLGAGEAPPRGAQGLVFTFELLEGAGQFRVIVDEESGASYVLDLQSQPARGVPMEAVAMFEDATPGYGWSKPDPTGRLEPETIRSFKIGCNTKDSRVRFVIKDLRWARF